MKIVNKYILTIFSVLILFSIYSASYGADALNSISGKIKFSEEGKIYVWLLTEEDYTKDKGPAHNQNILIIDPTPENCKAESVNFTLKNIPAGTYGIQVWQDENSNNKFDVGIFGPKEGWGMYKHSRPFASKPKFDDFSFVLNNNIDNADVTVE